MLFRLILLVILNLSVLYGSKIPLSEYQLSSFSQLIRVGNNTEHDAPRRSQLHNATIMISPKLRGATQILFGFFESDSVKVPFEIVYDEKVTKGILVKELKVSPTATQWNVESIRAFAGAHQLLHFDITESKEDDWIMEETISGKCKTHYSTKRSTDNGNSYIDIVKTKDYTDCSKIAQFHIGMYGKQNLDALLKNGNIISRKTVTSMKIMEQKRGQDFPTHYYRNSTVVRSEITLMMNDDIFKAEGDLTITHKSDSDTDSSYYNSFPKNLISVGGLMSSGWDEQSRHCGINEIDSNCRNFNSNLNAYKGREVKIVTEMTTIITQELSNVNDIPVTNALERFTVLIGVIKTMDFESLKESGNILMKNKSEWFVFKNAVSVAGTLNALKAIKWFLKMGALTLEDDAELIMALPNHCEKVTLEYLDELFETVVNNTNGFDTTAIIPFSNLYRRYYIENSSPSERDILKDHASRKYSSFFSDKSILSRILNDNEQLQFFIRALGNTGNAHAFGELYKELSSNDKQDAFSPLHKLLYIQSADKIIELEPKLLNEVFHTMWKDMQNASSALRLALLNQMLKTDLDSEFLVTILNDVKSSPDRVLRKGAKKSVISELFNYYLNDTIRDLTNSIDDEECARRSCGAMNEFQYEKQDESNWIYFLLEAVGNYDEFPSYVSLDIKKDVRGYEKMLKLSGMLNYRRHFLHNDYYPHTSSLSSGNIRLDQDFNQYFYTSEKMTSSNVLEKLMTKFKHGDRFLVKSLTSDWVTIDLPLENGFLFRYTYNDPEYLYFNFRSPEYDSATMMLGSHLVYSKTEQFKVGIVDSSNGIQYLYGNNYNVHINVPLDITLTKDQKVTLTLKPLFKEGQQRIFHFSNAPFYTQRSSYPVTTVAGEATHENYPGDKSLETDNLKLDGTGRFIFEMIDNDDDDDMEWPELDVNLGGPFRNYSSKRSLYSLTFEEDLNAQTALVVSLDLSNRSEYVNVTETSDYGNMKGPFMFNGNDIFHLDLLLTGPTNRSLTMTLKQLRSTLKRYVTKYEANLSYYENDTSEFEVCGTAVGQLPYFQTDTNVGGVTMTKVSYTDPDGSIKMSAYADLKFGKTCVNNSFISVETDINLSENKKQNFNLTIDFRDLDNDIEPFLCMFEGDYKDTEILDYSFNIIFKDGSICGKSKDVSEKSDVNNSISKSND